MYIVIFYLIRILYSVLCGWGGVGDMLLIFLLYYIFAFILLPSTYYIYILYTIYTVLLFYLLYLLL